MNNLELSELFINEVRSAVLRHRTGKPMDDDFLVYMSSTNDKCNKLFEIISSALSSGSLSGGLDGLTLPEIVSVGLLFPSIRDLICVQCVTEILNGRLHGATAKQCIAEIQSTISGCCRFAHDTGNIQELLGRLAQIMLSFQFNGSQLEAKHLLFEMVPFVVAKLASLENCAHRLDTVINTILDSITDNISSSLIYCSLLVSIYGGLSAAQIHSFKIKILELFSMVRFGGPIQVDDIIELLKSSLQLLNYNFDSDWGHMFRYIYGIVPPECEAILEELLLSCKSQTMCLVNLIEDTAMASISPSTATAIKERSLGDAIHRLQCHVDAWDARLLLLINRSLHKLEQNDAELSLPILLVEDADVASSSRLSALRHSRAIAVTLLCAIYHEHTDGFASSRFQDLVVHSLRTIFLNGTRPEYNGTSNCSSGSNSSSSSGWGNSQYNGSGMGILRANDMWTLSYRAVELVNTMLIVGCHPSQLDPVIREIVAFRDNDEFKCITGPAFIESVLVSVFRLLPQKEQRIAYFSLLLDGVRATVTAAESDMDCLATRNDNRRLASSQRKNLENVERLDRPLLCFRKIVLQCLQALRFECSEYLDGDFEFAVAKLIGDLSVASDQVWRTLEVYGCSGCVFEKLLCFHRKGLSSNFANIALATNSVKQLCSLAYSVGHDGSGKQEQALGALLAAPIQFAAKRQMHWSVSTLLFTDIYNIHSSSEREIRMSRFSSVSLMKLQQYCASKLRGLASVFKPSKWISTVDTGGNMHFQFGEDLRNILCLFAASLALADESAFLLEMRDVALWITRTNSSPPSKPARDPNSSVLSAVFANVIEYLDQTIIFDEFDQNGVLMLGCFGVVMEILDALVTSFNLCVFCSRRCVDGLSQEFLSALAALCNLQDFIFNICSNEGKPIADPVSPNDSFQKTDQSPSSPTSYLPKAPLISTLGPNINDLFDFRCALQNLYETDTLMLPSHKWKTGSSLKGKEQDQCGQQDSFWMTSLLGLSDSLRCAVLPALDATTERPISCRIGIVNNLAALMAINCTHLLAQLKSESDLKSEGRMTCEIPFAVRHAELVDYVIEGLWVAFERFGTVVAEQSVRSMQLSTVEEMADQRRSTAKDKARRKQPSISYRLIAERSFQTRQVAEQLQQQVTKEDVSAAHVKNSSIGVLEECVEIGFTACEHSFLLNLSEELRSRLRRPDIKTGDVNSYFLNLGRRMEIEVDCSSQIAIQSCRAQLLEALCLALQCKDKIVTMNATEVNGSCHSVRERALLVATELVSGLIEGLLEKTLKGYLNVLEGLSRLCSLNRDATADHEECNVPHQLKLCLSHCMKCPDHVASKIVNILFQFCRSSEESRSYCKTFLKDISVVNKQQTRKLKINQQEDIDSDDEINGPNRQMQFDSDEDESEDYRVPDADMGAAGNADSVHADIVLPVLTCVLERLKYEWEAVVALKEDGAANNLEFRSRYHELCDALAILFADGDSSEVSLLQMLSRSQLKIFAGMLFSIVTCGCKEMQSMTKLISAARNQSRSKKRLNREQKHSKRQRVIAKEAECSEMDLEDCDNEGENGSESNDSGWSVPTRPTVVCDQFPLLAEIVESVASIGNNNIISAISTVSLAYIQENPDSPAMTRVMKAVADFRKCLKNLLGILKGSIDQSPWIPETLRSLSIGIHFVGEAFQSSLGEDDDAQGSSVPNPASITSRRNKRRQELMMRSKHPVINEWQQDRIDGDEISEYVQDSFADLEEFIVSDVDEADSD